MTKTEKLILTLCRECIGDSGFLFVIYTSGDICASGSRRVNEAREWEINCDSKDFEQQLTTAIKEIREIKRGAK